MSGHMLSTRTLHHVHGRSWLLLVAGLLLMQPAVFYDAIGNDFRRTIASVESKQQKQQMDEICTPDLLLEENDAAANTTTAANTRENSSGWKFSNQTGEWRWLVPDRGQRACGSSFLKPLQSTPRDIQVALSHKWLLMIGDSSVRMLHDYLVGRWLGNYTHWPKEVNNHGPREHNRPCRGDYQHIMAGVNFPPPKSCTYDVFLGGSRITYIWFGLDLSEELSRTLRQTIGSPDMVVAQHGYWEITSKRDPAEAGKAPQKLKTILDHREMESLYAPAYHHPPQQKRVWMSLFDSVYGPYDGSKEAKELGWEVFDRTKLVSFDGKRAGLHPTNEVLELELEILLVLLNDTGLQT